MRGPIYLARKKGVATLVCGLLALIAVVNAQDACLDEGAPCTDSSVCCGECVQDECPASSSPTSPAARRMLDTDCPALCRSREEADGASAEETEDEAAYTEIYGEDVYDDEVGEGNSNAEKQKDTATPAGEDAVQAAGGDTDMSSDTMASEEAEAEGKGDGDGTEPDSDCARFRRACSEDVKCCGTTMRCKGGICTSRFGGRFRSPRKTKPDGGFRTPDGRIRSAALYAPPPPKPCHGKRRLGQRCMNGLKM